MEFNLTWTPSTNPNLDHYSVRTAPGPTIDPICRALSITLPPIFQELPTQLRPITSCGA